VALRERLGQDREDTSADIFAPIDRLLIGLPGDLNVITEECVKPEWAIFSRVGGSTCKKPQTCGRSCLA
jgi:hypothetical protein